MKILIKYVSVLFILLPFYIDAQSEEKLKMAVLDFNNTGGLSIQESSTLANRLRSMLVKHDNLIVIERGMMDEILSEQGFQQTGCTSTECAVEVGKLLNVKKMVTGSIGKIGETYTIDIVLIDVATAQINTSFIRNHKGAVDGLLEVIRSISDQIAGFGIEKEEVKKYVISITSSPGDADLFINDKRIGKTPFKSTADDGRDLKITIKKENYEDWGKRITVKDNIEIEAKLEMTEAYKTALVKKAKKEKEEAVVKKESKGGSSWLWYVGGAALVGGGAAAYFLMSEKDEEKPDKVIGTPPGEPQVP